MKISLKEPSTSGFVDVSRETMNSQSLHFHTRLYDWSDTKALGTQHVEALRIGSGKTNHKHYLTPPKLFQIESWRQDVNRIFIRRKPPEPKESFMKINVSAFNIKRFKKVRSGPPTTNLTDRQKLQLKLSSAKLTRSQSEVPRRSQSAVPPTDQSIVPARCQSALPTASTLKVPSRRIASAGQASHKKFFGTDVTSVTNHLIDTSLHYSAQRREINSRVNSRNTHSARTGTRSITYPLLENHTPDIDEGNQPRQLLNGTERHIISQAAESDELEIQDAQSENFSLTYHSHSGSQVTELDHYLEDDNKSEMSEQGKVLQVKNHVVITSRSSSNRILNCYSIDDCKMACRYRPRTITEQVRSEHVIDERTKRKLEELSLHDTDDTTISMETRSSENQSEEKVTRKNQPNSELQEVSISGNPDITTYSPEKKITESAKEMKSQDLNTLPNGIENIAVPHPQHFPGSNFQDGMISNDGHENQRREDVSEEKDRIKSPPMSLDKVNGNALEPRLSDTASPTSYGRITTLYTTSQYSMEPQEKKKKKDSRPVRISHAIDKMVADRKVMNPMDRNFDVRTQEAGRTIVDKGEGSVTFHKMNAILKKRVESIMEGQSVIKNKQYYQRRLRNAKLGGSNDSVAKSQHTDMDV